MAPRPTTKELQEMAREAFGCRLDEEEVERYRRRLPGMVMAARLLKAWEPRLAGVEPAAVRRVPPARDGNGG